MSKPFPIGWAEAAGRAAGEREHGGGPEVGTASRRPKHWTPGTQREVIERSHRANRKAALVRAVARKLDETLGTETDE